MAISVTQTTAKARGTAQTALPVSFGSLPAIGSLLVCQVAGWKSTNFAVTSVTDNQTGNTWARAIQGPLAGGARPEIWWTKVVGSTGTFTVTVNCTSSTVVFSVSEVAGFVNPMVDKTATNTQAPPTTAPSTGTTALTLTTDEYLIGGTTADTGAVYTYSARNVAGSNPSSGWASVLNEPDSNAYQACDFVSVVASATGAMGHIWTVDGNSGWISCLATFRERATIKRNPVMAMQAVKRAATW